MLLEEKALWIGPEGGHILFLQQRKSFVYETGKLRHSWYYSVPSHLSTDTSALFGNDIATENYSGTSSNSVLRER